jgi:glycosyltransferase involved in cell wall biosynthesis
MSERLAIVVPAYKPEHLSEAMESLARQTSRDFSVVVGDDASPSDLASIVEPFRSRLDLSYVRFEENLGGRDLVGHWQRCLDLVAEGTEWIWLFSDDDVADPECVQEFHRRRVDFPGCEVFHFDIDIIDREGRLLKSCAPYPPLLDVGDFFSRLYRGRIDARMPEFVFSRPALLREGGFVRFDLAFRSDNATVIQVGRRGGIATIQGPKVHWRLTGSSVSSDRERTLSLRRLASTIEFFDWIEAMARRGELRLSITWIERARVVLENAAPMVPEFGMPVVEEMLRRCGYFRRLPSWFAGKLFLRFQNRFYPRCRGL